MATIKKTNSSQPVKLTPTQMRKKIETLEAENEKLRNEVGNLIKKGESYTKKQDQSMTSFFDILNMIVQELKV